MVRKPRGMSTAEYGLILAAIAMMVYGSYLALGSNVRFLVSGADSALTTGYRAAAAAEATPKP